jgi:hypothetical protein
LPCSSYFLNSLYCTVATEVGSAEQKRNLERKRNIVILMHQHLIECGQSD